MASATIESKQMGFQLSDVVPWGRSFDEYVAMFSLTQADFRGRILGCGDGPASFNAVATQRGYRVTSADPIYAFTADQIRTRVQETAQTISAEVRLNPHEFVWTQFHSVEELIAARLAAMEIYLRDFDSRDRAGRYVAAVLPSLPFRSGQFDLALCSHFLFLYSAQRDLAFHLESVRELTRVSREVRIFPLLELGSRISRHLTEVMQVLEREDYSVERVEVPYEVQKGGNEMIRITNGTRS